MGLSNPYSQPFRPSGAGRLQRVLWTGGAVAGGAVVGIVVVTGCSGDDDAGPPAPRAVPSSATPPAEPMPTSPPPAPAPGATAAPSPPPVGAASTAATPGRPAVPSERALGPPRLANDGADHRVVRGDTLSAIAARYDVDGGWPRVWARNCDVLYDPDFILPGQEIDLDGPVIPQCAS